LLKNTLVPNTISHRAFGTAKYHPPTSGEVEIEPHFEKRMNLLLVADFTMSKFRYSNYLGQQ
jgi:hypothetical protein